MPQLSSDVAAGARVRILAIDGGGIRGMLPARLLAELERRLNRPTADIFHLVSGTSTGGIISCGVATGLSAKALGDLYATRGHEIFSRSRWQHATNPAQLTGPKYGHLTLEAILAGLLGEMRLSDVRSTELLVPAYAIELPQSQAQDGFDVVSTRTPMFFKSWKARGVGLEAGEEQDAFNFALKDVARATSAAPTYFEPARVVNAKGEAYAAVDGGVFANNPSLCALTAAIKLYPGAKITLVSLGTGAMERDIPYAHARRWGDLHWLQPMLSILFNGNADTVCYQCDQLLGEDHHRFEITLGRDPRDPTSVNEDFDDATPDNTARLERLAQKLIRSADAELDRLAEKLSA